MKKIETTLSLNKNNQEELEMNKYAITRIPEYHFHYRDFRYTNLKDAIAQAKRDECSYETEHSS